MLIGFSNTLLLSLFLQSFIATGCGFKITHISTEQSKIHFLNFIQSSTAIQQMSFKRNIDTVDRYELCWSLGEASFGKPPEQKNKINIFDLNKRVLQRLKLTVLARSQLWKWAQGECLWKPFHLRCAPPTFACPGICVETSPYMYFWPLVGPVACC